MDDASEDVGEDVGEDVVETSTPPKIAARKGPPPKIGGPKKGVIKKAPPEKETKQRLLLKRRSPIISLLKAGFGRKISLTYLATWIKQGKQLCAHHHRDLEANLGVLVRPVQWK